MKYSLLLFLFICNSCTNEIEDYNENKQYIDTITVSHKSLINPIEDELCLTNISTFTDTLLYYLGYTEFIENNFQREEYYIINILNPNGKGTLFYLNNYNDTLTVKYQTYYLYPYQAKNHESYNLSYENIPNKFGGLFNLGIKIDTVFLLPITKNTNNYLNFLEKEFWNLNSYSNNDTIKHHYSLEKCRIVGIKNNQCHYIERLKHLPNQKIWASIEIFLDELKQENY